MSAALVLLFLIGMAAIVWSACFVGCNLGHGPPSVFDRYHNTVLGTRGLVAYWPLSDTVGPIAVDLGPNGFDGGYSTGPDVTSYNAARQSDASPGTFALNQPNIVAGDATSRSGAPATPNPCVLFNGGFVSVAWRAALGPPMPGQFTLEAWVVPNWTLEDAQTNRSSRVVVASASASPSPDTGFALYATPDNVWAAGIGLGATEAVAVSGSNQTIVQGSLDFLVVTYDGTTLTLWVNPADTTQPPAASVTASGYVPVPPPVHLYIGTGRPDLRTPLFPFNGFIQDVAFYNVVLDGTTIETHYAAGLGVHM
jgi:hypothetical protein